MANETNVFRFGEGADPVEKARAALSAVRQYQQDWQNHGVGRVHQYFDDVEGEWIDNFEEICVNCPVESISSTNFTEIYKQLKSLGLSKSFIENVALPSWWKSKFEDNGLQISRLLMSLAKRLRLEINFFQGSSQLSLNFIPIPAKKFKLQKKQKNPELFSYLSTSIANVIVESVERPYIPISANPLVIRESILKKNFRISLNSLLDFCWSCGVPVVQFDFLDVFGKGKNTPPKSDGLVVMTEDRPVVIIGSSRKQSAWLLFILAHELGHIANGDLQDGILVDSTFLGGFIDQEEEKANQFAKQLLFGNFTLQWDRKLSRNSLLAEARKLSHKHRLDPGSVVLNYAWQTNDWKQAMAALKVLEPNANAPMQINSYYQSHFSSIDEESREYLKRVNVLAA